MPPKRSAPPDASQSRVRKRAEHADRALLETTSIEERAEPYRLMTARFPIDDVTPEWSKGCNRKIDEKHVKQLCRLFEEHGVNRLDRAHRVRLVCRLQDVRLMCERVGIECKPNDPVAPLPSFRGWSDTIAHAAEVLAGNHRIQALKAYLEQRKLASDDDERWWVCDIFDRDTLPLELQIELRANRSGTILPDTHGQIWTELCTYSEQDESGMMFSGARGDVEVRMSRALRLNTREQFPVRRLAILWKNDRWRTFISRLCGRRAGKDLFNISVFQKLSSYRIDDYLFERLETIIRPVETIWGELGIELEMDRDYVWLAGLRRRWKLRELFYPKDHDGHDISKDSPRHRQFLSHVDRAKYDALYRFLVERGRELSFPNAHELLRTLNSCGKTMQAVMTHVIMWLNKELASVKDREGNKPPLAEELLPVVSSVLEMAVRNGPSPAARAKVLELQRRALVCVEKNPAAFTKEDLSFLPEDGTEPKIYQERFRLEAWRDVLVGVREVIGPRLCNSCVSNFDVETIRQPSQPARSGLVDMLQDTVTRHPDIIENPALKSSEAKDALIVMMQEVVAQWKREYGQDELRLQGKHHELPATITELARLRDASLSRKSSIDEVHDRNPVTQTARKSITVHSQAAEQRRLGASLFVESSESEADFEPPKAPVAPMVSPSPPEKRHESTRAAQLSVQGQPSTIEQFFSDDEQRSEREVSSSLDRIVAEAITKSTARPPRRKEAPSMGEGGETQPKTHTLGPARATSLPSKPLAKGQQRRGWRTRPVAGR